MGTRKYFDDTLNEFYKNSNEVESHIEIFNSYILPKLTKYKKLNWLEVGIGNGAKIIDHLIRFDTKPNLNIIEPSKKWINFLIESKKLNDIEEVTSDLTINNSTFEEFNKNIFYSNYNYISFNQVIYDDAILDDLMNFINHNKNKKPFWLFINLENETSDLYKLRELLKVEFPKISTSKLPEVLKYFDDNKIEYECYNTINKTLNIDINRIKNDFTYWFYPFILGVDKHSFNNLENDLKFKIKEVILKYSDNKRKFVINDTSLLINIKKNNYGEI